MLFFNQKLYFISQARATLTLTLVWYYVNERLSDVEQANELTIALHNHSSASKEHINIFYLNGIILLLLGRIFWYFKLICEHCKLEQDEQIICYTWHLMSRGHLVHQTRNFWLILSTKVRKP